MKLLTNLLLSAVCFGYATTVAAQPTSHFGIRVGPRYNLNTLNTDDDAITTGRNTVSAAVSGIYNLRFKNGFIIEAGVTYGGVKEKMRVYFPLDDFDPDARLATKGQLLDFTKSYSMRYIAPHLAIGYAFKIKQHYQVDVLAGASRWWYLNGHAEQFSYDLGYTDDLGQQKIIPRFFYRVGSMGDLRNLIGGAQLQVTNYELISQVRKSIKTFLFNEVSAGLRFSFATNQSRSAAVSDVYLDRINESPKISEYVIRNWGLQLTIGVGF